jgi:hypothetical protein
MATMKAPASGRRARPGKAIAPCGPPWSKQPTPRREPGAPISVRSAGGWRHAGEKASDSGRGAFDARHGLLHDPTAGALPRSRGRLFRPATARRHRSTARQTLTKPCLSCDPAESLNRRNTLTTTVIFTSVSKTTKSQDVLTCFAGVRATWAAPGSRQAVTRHTGSLGPCVRKIPLTPVTFPRRQPKVDNM